MSETKAPAGRPFSVAGRKLARNVEAAAAEDPKTRQDGIELGYLRPDGTANPDHPEYYR